MRRREPISAVSKEKEESERDTVNKLEKELQTSNFLKDIQNWEQKEKEKKVEEKNISETEDK